MNSKQRSYTEERVAIIIRRQVLQVYHFLGKKIGGNHPTFLSTIIKKDFHKYKKNNIMWHEIHKEKDIKLRNKICWIYCYWIKKKFIIPGSLPNKKQFVPQFEEDGEVD